MNIGNDTKAALLLLDEVAGASASFMMNFITWNSMWTVNYVAGTKTVSISLVCVWLQFVLSQLLVPESLL